MSSVAAPPRSGPGWAEHLQWTGPFPDGADFRQARLEAEQLPSRILLPAYGSLPAAELDEFADLIEATRNAIDM